MGRGSAGRRLRLYVAGTTPNSARAARNLSAVLQELDGEAKSFHPEIIDVLLDAKKAMLDEIIVTPTLVVTGPGGALTLIGDLADTAELKRLLQKFRDQPAD